MRLFLSGAAIFFPTIASAAQVKGFVDPMIVPARPKTLGYTKTKIAAASKGFQVHREDTAIFLKVKESLPLPASEPFKVSISGLRLLPAVAACVVDGKVAFTNDEKTPVHLMVDQKVVAELKPGESKTYDCMSADPNLRRIQVKEWPHIRGTLFVGDIGVVAAPAANGAFALQASQGKYELEVIGPEGVLSKQDVEVVKADVDVQRISLQAAGGLEVPPEARVDVKPGKGVPKKAPPPAKRRPVGDTQLQFDNQGSGP